MWALAKQVPTVSRTRIEMCRGNDAGRRDFSIQYDVDGCDSDVFDGRQQRTLGCLRGQE